MFICFRKSLLKSCSLPVLNLYNCIIRLARETLERDCIQAISCHLLFGKALVDPQAVPLGTPCVLSSSKQSQRCPSAHTDVSSLVGPPGHFSFSWSVPVFVPGAFPPHVLSILQPQVLHCPFRSCIQLPAGFLMFFSALELIFSLICSAFPAFECTSFSVIPGHNAGNEGKEKIIKKKDKNPFLP